ncbi:MAG: glycosyltransferase, partial [Burkholderiales bacterium]
MTGTLQLPESTQGIDDGGARAPREQARFPVMVLAHNEERHIGACLDSIFAADLALDFDVYVMANGCTDRTEAIVADHARARPHVHLVSIALGDKCNA